MSALAPVARATPTAGGRWPSRILTTWRRSRRLPAPRAPPRARRVVRSAEPAPAELAPGAPRHPPGRRARAGRPGRPDPEDVHRNRVPSAPPGAQAPRTRAQALESLAVDAYAKALGEALRPLEQEPFEIAIHDNRVQFEQTGKRLVSRIVGREKSNRLTAQVEAASHGPCLQLGRGPSAVAHAPVQAPRAARVQAAEGARAAGRSAFRRASTVPPSPGDGGAPPTCPVARPRSAGAGTSRVDVADDPFP